MRVSKELRQLYMRFCVESDCTKHRRTHKVFGRSVSVRWAFREVNLTFPPQCKVGFTEWKKECKQLFTRHRNHAKAPVVLSKSGNNSS